MTSPRNSSIDAAPARGSVDELIEPFLPEQERHALTVARGLRRTLLALGREATPATELQSAWWRDEIQRLAAGEARHPLTRALQSSTAEPTIDTGWLDELIVAAESDRAGHRPESIESLRLDLFRRVVGPFAIASVLCGVDPLPNEAIKRIGIGFGFFQLIDSSAVSDSPATPVSIDLPEPLAGTTGARRDALVSAGLDELHGVALPPGTPTFLAVYAALSEAGLKRARRQRTMSRLGRLWIVWNTARRSRSRTEKGAAKP